MAGTKKRVVQYNQIGTEIARYSCSKEACEALVKSGRLKESTYPRRYLNINKNCNRETKTCYGFVFRYEKDIINDRKSN